MIEPNPLLAVYVTAYIGTTLADMGLDQLNLRHTRRHSNAVPRGFEGVVDSGVLHRMGRYSAEKTRLSHIEQATVKIIFLALLLSGILPQLSTWLSHMNFLLAGVIFFALPALVTAIPRLPFDYHDTFGIEARFGFNTSTRAIWLIDQLKSIVLSGAFGIALLVSLLLLIDWTGHMWWIWACAVFLGFQLLLTVLYPTVIAPLFNTFTPVEDPRLASKIRDMAEKENLKVRGVYQMDASRRSRHTNAYFSGIGKSKRIVLFDSLIQSHSEDEIMAILAHEIGHLKGGHIKKQFLVVAVASILLFYSASLMLGWNPMFSAFGFTLTPDYVGLFLVGVLWGPAAFFISPLGMALSRRFEREADAFSLQVMGTAEPLVQGLKKMARENLSNLIPHPTYVLFNYSHPPLLERIRSLEHHGRPGMKS